MSKIIVGICFGVMLLIVAAYMAPMVNMIYQQHRADADVSQTESAYRETVKSADARMAQEIAQARAEHDGTVMGAQNLRDADLREIKAKYPKAKLPRTLAIADKVQ